VEHGQVVISKRGVDRVRRGHLWVYRSDLINDKDAEAGGIVAVRDQRGTILGKAFFSFKSRFVFLRAAMSPLMNRFLLAVLPTRITCANG
jgi:pseudouridine/archaeosine synthase-like protein